MGSNEKKKQERRERAEADHRVSMAASVLASMSLRKKLFFSMVPVCVLFVLAEVSVRVLGLAVPALKTSPFEEEIIGLIQPDPVLFWSLKPGQEYAYKGGLVKVNQWGLRAPEIQPKAESEYRILSLGESATFGVGTDNSQTYTERFGALLQKRRPGRSFLAINAGVPAWSSFQSLKFLETRGLNLEPDLVLFYHELNDYLPSTLRNSGHDEIGAMKTDPQLYASRVQGLRRQLVQRSALFKLIAHRVALRRIRSFNQHDFESPLMTVGLPDVNIWPRLTPAKKMGGVSLDLNEESLGQRVSEPERKRILERLVALCEQENIRLVIIHPSYRDSRKHDCLLTGFCRDNRVLMYEAFDALHPPDQPSRYLDAWHPSREGHEELARGLADFVFHRIPISQRSFPH
jgi:hypothetical protein